MIVLRIDCVLLLPVHVVRFVTSLHLEAVMHTFLSLFSDVLVLSFILFAHVALSSGSVLPATIDDTTGDSLTGAQPSYSGSFSAVRLRIVFCG
jgi:hypothetical protein